MDKERATRQLQIIAETNEIAQSLGADVWLRGGWAMDFYLGELTRDHEDIDWFAWISDAAKLTTELPATTWPTHRSAARLRQG